MENETDVRVEMQQATNPVKAIRLKCRDCTNGQISEIDECPVKLCPIHAFRFGKNPYRTKRVLTDEQRTVAAERLAQARLKNQNLEA